MKYELVADRVAKEELRRDAATVLLGAAVLIPGAWATILLMSWLGTSRIGQWFLPYTLQGGSDAVRDGFLALFMAMLGLLATLLGLVLIVVVFYRAGCLLRKLVQRVGIQSCPK